MVAPVWFLVVCGTLDRTCPAWHSRELAERIPGAKSLWLADKGHMLMFEAPDVIVETVRQREPAGAAALQPTPT